MDVLWCKTQMAWITMNVGDAQKHIDERDIQSLEIDLLYIDRALRRVRDEMKKEVQQPCPA